MQFKNKHNKSIKQTTWLKKLFKLLHLQSLTLDSLFGTEYLKFMFSAKYGFLDPLKALVVQYFLGKCSLKELKPKLETL